MSFQLICCRRYRSLGGESKLSTSEGDEQSRENGDDCLNQINLGIQKLISKTALPSESPNSPFAAINSEIELPADSIAAKFFLFLLSVRNEPVVARHGLERLGEMRPMSHASFQLSANPSIRNECHCRRVGSILLEAVAAYSSSNG